MGALVQLGIYGGIMLTRWAYHRWLDGDEKRPRPPAQEVQTPRNDMGAPAPLVFGRCRVRAPLFAWRGRVQYVDDNTRGVRVYALDMKFIVGVVMGNGVARGNSLAGPKLHNVWIGDYKLPSVSNSTNSNTDGFPRVVGVNQQFGQMVARHNQYGGAGRGGGLIGAYWWHGGWTDQNFTSPASRVGDRMQAASIGASRIPGLKRQMVVSFGSMPQDSSDSYFNQTRPDTGGTVEATPLPGHGFIFGESPSLSTPSFEVSTYGDRLNDVTKQHRFSMKEEGVDFGGDADPVEVIYCVLTDPLGKLGLDSSLIDTASFSAASATLKAENHGYSRVWEDAVEADEIIQDVLAQIDGVLDWDPRIGKIVIKLIRPDFNPNDILEINRKNCEKLMSFTISGHDGLINSVQVRFEDRSNNYDAGSTQARNPANAVGQSGALNELILEYGGCKRLILAHRLARRELAARSKPTIKCRAMVKRSFLRVMRGDPVKLTWTNPDVSGLIFRVANVEHGTRENGMIALDLISDPNFVWRGELQVLVDEIRDNPVFSGGLT